MRIGWLALALLSIASGTHALTLDELRAQRAELAQRERRIIVNNDGNDAVYECAEATPEALLAARTTGLAGTQVDTIVYCTWCSGFGLCTHRSEVAEPFVTTEGAYEHNITAALFDQGTDPLQIVVDFCRANGIEVFWSMRMNDIHDGAMRRGAQANPELFPAFKRAHPDWLLGAPGEALPAIPGPEFWSAVDYSRPEVRERAFRLIEDVCRRYEVDGVELDFFRHLAYFPGHARAGRATDAECALMTDLLRRIRAMTEGVGLARGRPLLLAIRVPDHPGYAQQLGLDWAAWLDEGLIDILVPSCTFRLRPWEATIAEGHAAGVAVYPSLSPSYMRRDQRPPRWGPDTYRARAAAAWLAGADGIYVFNYPHPDSELWTQLGSPETLHGLAKRYWPTVRGPRMITQVLRDGERYLELPTLCADRPEVLISGRPLQVPLVVADDLQRAQEEGLDPQATLKVICHLPGGAAALTVTVNDTPLTGPAPVEGGFAWEVPSEALRMGVNEVIINHLPEFLPAAVVHDLRLDVSFAAPG